MDKKWYVAGTCVEGHSSCFTVELSDTEFEGVKKFVVASDDNSVWYECYSGSFWIDDTPYNTKEDAEKEAWGIRC